MLASTQLEFRSCNIFSQVVREYDSIGVQVLLANPATPLCEALNRYGFFRRYSSERLFPSVAIAVRYTRDGNRVVSGTVNASNNS